MSIPSEIISSHLFKFFNSTDEVGTGGEYLHCSGASTNTVNLQQLQTWQWTPTSCLPRERIKLGYPKVPTGNTALFYTYIYIYDMWCTWSRLGRWNSIFNIREHRWLYVIYSTMKCTSAMVKILYISGKITGATSGICVSVTSRVNSGNMSNNSKHIRRKKLITSVTIFLWKK